MAINTTSFNLTPQATDDAFLYTSLTEDSLTTTILDVMVNDLGGNAKTLYSLDNGIEDEGSATSADLLTKDVVGAANNSYNGATISITANGKVSYNAATLSAAFKDQLQHLGAGQYLDDTFTYAIRMANGTLSWATASVRIYGVNDVAVIGGATTGSVTEDVAVAADHIATSGALTITDVDTGEDHFQTQASTAGSNGYGVFTLDAAGAWTYSADNTQTAIQQLGDGETLTDSFTAVSADGTTQVVTVTIHGTNDAPVLTVADTSANVAEDGTVTDSGALSFTDVDIHDTHAVTAAYNGDASWTGGTLSAAQITAITAGFTADSDSWDYAVANSALQFLGDGETITLSFDVTVSDGHGGSDTETVTVTLTGQNDAPAVSGDVTDSVLEGGSSSTLDALANATDADQTDTLTVTDLPATLPDGVTYDALTHSFTLDPTNGAYDHLADGDHATVSVTYSVSDGLTSTPATVSWTVTGTNDAPLVSGDVTASVLEGGSSSTLDALANASDVDDSTTLSVIDVPVTLPDGVTYDALTHSFTLDPTNGAYDHLADGDHTTVSVTYSVSDGLTSTPATVSWTVTGTNDAPVITEGASDLSPTGNEDTLITGAVQATDVDDGDTLAFSVVNSGTGAPAHGTVSIDANTGGYTYTPDANYNGSDSFTVTVTDSHNLTDTVVVNVDVTPVNDAPVINDLTSNLSPAGDEDTLITGAIVATDVDGDSLTYSAPAEGDPDGPAHGSVSFDSAGGYTYTPDANYNGSDSFTVTVSDGQGGTNTVGVSVTVNPVNDAPSLSDPTDISYLDTSATDNFTGVSSSLSASDIDSATLSYSLTGAVSDASLLGYDVSKASTYGTMYLNTATGAYHFEPDDAAINGLAAGSNPTVDFEFTASDGSAASNAQTLTVHLTGADEAAGAPVSPPVYTGADPNDFDTVPSGGSSLATIHGTGGDDTLIGGSPDQNIDGQNGADTIYGAGGNDNISGNNGNDALYGNTGNDTISGGNDVDSIYGGSGADALTGGNGVDTIYGGSGNDTINGSGNSDILIGGYGADAMTGGTDAGDTFLYLDVKDTGDTITDFTHGSDKIDLSALDANTALANDQAFIFVAADTNAVQANSITFHYDSVANVTHIWADVNGDANADLAIDLTGNIGLTSGDFIL